MMLIVYLILEILKFAAFLFNSCINQLYHKRLHLLGVILLKMTRLLQDFIWY